MRDVLSEGEESHFEYTEEPHLTRRKAMLQKHPELKLLMKPNGDRRMVFIGLSLVVLQLTLAYVNYQFIESMPLRFMLNVLIGSWISSAIFVQIHESAHGLVFGPNHVWKNRFYGILINLTLAFPLFGYFKKHHKAHHKHLHELNIDIEAPHKFETKYFKGCLGKYAWLYANPYLQLHRSMPQGQYGIESYRRMTFEEKACMWTFVIMSLYLWFSGYFYFYSHLWMANFISLTTNYVGFLGAVVHTEFFSHEDTIGYYGWMNYFMTNLGYHMEHHDFPNIPARYLREIRKIAPEYYEDCHTLDSVYTPVVKFIFDAKYGLFSRMKRVSTKL